MTRFSQGRAFDLATAETADTHPLHETLWPILADERGDVLSIKLAALEFKKRWLSLQRPFDEPVFNQAVELWEGWSESFGKIVESMEACLRAVRLTDTVPDIWQDVLLFLRPLLIDAMLAEVPKLANSARKQGRPTEHSRNYVVDQVFDGFGGLLGTYPRDSRTLDGSLIDSDKAGWELDFFL